MPHVALHSTGCSPKARQRECLLWAEPLLPRRLCEGRTKRTPRRRNDSCRPFPDCWHNLCLRGAHCAFKYLPAPGKHPHQPLAAVFVFLALAISFVQGFLLIAIGIGFLKLQNWARVLLIILIGLGFLGGIRGLVTSGANGILQSPGPAFILAAISIGILMYLFSPRVKQAFGATRL